MLLLGHAGITLGVAVAAEALRTPRTSPASIRAALMPRWFGDALVSLSHRVDLRVLLVGSLLPDIIDKPVGLLFFPDLFGTGRLFCHALVFPCALAVVGTALYLTRKTNVLLVLAYGATMHLVLDSMWLHPGTLFWPVTELSLPAAPPANWLGNILLALLTNRCAYLSELAGAILLTPLLSMVARKGGILRFLRTGIVD